MGIKDLGGGKWAADSRPGEVFYSSQAASDADKKSGSSSSSSSRSKYTGLKLLGKMLSGLWKLFEGMFK